jgi:hypothetical protein
VLAGFASEHGIEYPLLSDEGSRVIEQFGILNTLVLPDEPVYGIPYPGSYVVGEDGRITDKFFHRQYQVRDTGATMLRSGFRLPVDLRGFPQAAAAEHGAKVSATLNTSDLKFMQRAELYVRIDLDEGQHVNGREAPQGYFATEVLVSGPEGLRVEDPQYPSTRPFKVQGLSEQFQVLDGEVEIVVPLVSSIREVDSIPIEIEVRYQACDEHECFLPQTERLTLDVPVGQLTRPPQR